MPVIFGQNTGRVIAITDNVASGSLSMVTLGAPITFTTHRTIISRIGLSVAGNYQFLHTIGQDVYLYVFGDRMGQIVLHGTSFETGCSQTAAGNLAVSGPGPGSPTFNGLSPPKTQTAKTAEHGFESLYKWYLANRIAAAPAPITVTLGRGTAFKGFVIGLNGDAQDAVYRTISFQLTLATLPDGGKI